MMGTDPQTIRLDRRRDPRARTPADALETPAPVLSQLRNRSRPWIAALFLLVASLSAASTAFGWACPRVAPDATTVAAQDAAAVVGPDYADSAPAQSTGPGLASSACGAPALAPVRAAALGVPPLRDATRTEPATRPAPAPDLAPRERPPLQS